MMCFYGHKHIDSSGPCPQCYEERRSAEQLHVAGLEAQLARAQAVIEAARPLGKRPEWPEGVGECPQPDCDYCRLASALEAYDTQTT